MVLCIGERLEATISYFYLSTSLSFSTSLVALSGIRISGLSLASLTSTNWFVTEDVLDTAADSIRAGLGVMQGLQTPHCSSLQQ